MGNEIWNRIQYVLSPQFDIYEQLSRVVKGKVVDVGSGTGFGAHLFLRNADKVVGYEVDPMARDFAQRVFSNGKIQFYQIDITKMIGNVGQADCVTMIDVIEHIENDESAILGCMSLLKPGGVFYCSTPNKKSRYRKSDNHVREYTPNELFGLLIGVFGRVEILDYQLKPATSEYENPIVARCQ